MEKMKFDVCIIGCGPAGFAAAMRSYDFDNHVCIIEGNQVGGAGIHDGALSSKTMWEISKDYATSKRTDRGYIASNFSVNYEQVIDTVYQAVREKQYQIRSQIETFSKKEGNSKSLTLIKGWGKFSTTKTVIVTKEDGELIEIEADNFIIASGSHPRKHPTLDIDGERIITSDHILNLKTFPHRILIIGAGVVGCEFATIFAEFGQTKVHLLDSQERVIPFEDDDVSDYASSMLENIGVEIHHTATLRGIHKHATHIDVILDYKEGHAEVIAVDAILISIGRVPTVKKLGLENIGVDITPRGLLEVNDRCQVKDNIYAVGDISGNAALVNIAEMEGRFAAKAIDSKIAYPLRYRNMSTIMFFNPEISAIGRNEKECQADSTAYKVVFYKHALIARAIAMRDTGGFFKLIVSDEDNPEILGMRAAGPQAAASIMYIATLMDQKTRLNEIMKTVHPHPSTTEGIQECLRMLVGKSIYKPEAFPHFISVKTWQPQS
ncbi:MAG: NAD(P)/FAD-dependent oxidoreductase [Campylobacterota bacterium]|nr:NAD(P)/FAD-dependent oxidoreductase [Campylobacterota bacterium]